MYAAVQEESMLQCRGYAQVQGVHPNALQCPHDVVAPIVVLIPRGLSVLRY